jgi:hypothetical protein
VLVEAIKKQVKEWLESSLHNRVYIIPEQDKNPSQVQPHRIIDVKSGSKPKVRLPENSHIITVFDQEGVDGRLLILGQPGAGKTTMLLELAKKLVERAENDLNKPIPILLSLSSWRNDYQSIKDWIVAELNSRKYYKVPKDIAKQWLEDGEIIPLLDGLDELATERQESCVQKLNEFLLPGNWSCPLVVCSRIEEYQLYSTQLALNTSLELQPFSDEQVQEYLRRTGNHQLGDSIRDDSALSELAKTPLLLNIIVSSCQKLSLDKWQILESSEERIDYLLSTYVEEMLEREYDGKSHSDEKQTKRWLGWLAGKLLEKNETEFFIENMQLSLLNKDYPKRKTYKIIVTLIFISIILPIFIVSGVLNNRLMYGVISGIFVGLILGVIVSRLSQINTIENLNFSWNKFKQNPSKDIITGFVVGLLVWLSEGQKIKGFFLGPILWLIIRIIEAFYSSEIEVKLVANQGIKRSATNACFIGLVGGLISGLSLGFVDELIIGVTSGLCFGLFFGLISGGITCIQHLSLRLILCFNKQIPWNYARFLDYATDRLFLQRVGGGYRFMHDLLRQHFAENYR